MIGHRSSVTRDRRPVTRDRRTITTGNRSLSRVPCSLSPELRFRLRSGPRGAVARPGWRCGRPAWPPIRRPAPTHRSAIAEALEFLGIFIGQHERFGPQAVAQRVPLRGLLALGRAWSGRAHGILPVGSRLSLGGYDRILRVSSAGWVGRASVRQSRFQGMQPRITRMTRMSGAVTVIPGFV